MYNFLLLGAQNNRCRDIVTSGECLTLPLPCYWADVIQALGKTRISPIIAECQVQRASVEQTWKKLGFVLDP